MMDREQLIGTWRLVDFRYTDADGNAGQPENGMTGGLIIYTADGYVAMATHREDGGFLSYFGRYEVGESHLVHHVEMSPEAALVGTEQRRAIRLEDGRLVLTASPSIIGGPGTSAELVWQRA